MQKVTAHNSTTVVRRLRKLLRCSQSSLAQRSGYSERTIKRLEKGLRVNTSTLTDVAQALLQIATEKRNPEALATAQALLNSLHTTSPHQLEFVIAVRIVIDHDIKAFTDSVQQHFVDEIRARLTAPGPIRIMDVSQGSVRLHILMRPEDADRLLDAFDDGRLSDIKVREVNVLGDVQPLPQGNVDIAYERVWERVVFRYRPTTPDAPDTIVESYDGVGQRQRRRPFNKRILLYIGLGLVLIAIAVVAIIIATRGKVTGEIITKGTGGVPIQGRWTNLFSVAIEVKNSTSDRVYVKNPRLHDNKDGTNHKLLYGNVNLTNGLAMVEPRQTRSFQLLLITPEFQKDYDSFKVMLDIQKNGNQYELILNYPAQRKGR